MTKLLSFSEWLEQQNTTTVNEAQSECTQGLKGQWADGCTFRDEPTCLSELVASCPLRKLYEKQREADLQRWEKWNRIGDEFTGRLPSEEVL